MPFVNLYRWQFKKLIFANLDNIATDKSLERMLPSYPTENYQMDMTLGSNKYPPQAPGSGKFVQAHGGQAYPPPGMESYMSQGMDPSMHPSARKAPSNPQASMGYGQGGMYSRGGMEMPMSPSNAAGMYGAAPGYHTGGYPQNLYAGGHPQRQMPPHHSMNPMMDGYGDRSGYGSHGMPPGHGGMHNPAMRMRYSAMMGQERWPPPPHQYMQQSQHHQAMASGPINRFQPPGGAPPDWAYPGGGEQFPGYPSTAMQARPAAALSSDERSSMPASPYMGMNAYSPGNQAYRQPHPSSHMKSSNPSLAGSPMGGYEQQAGSQHMQGNNLSIYMQQQQQAQGAAGNANALDEIGGSNNNMNISAQRMQAYLNKQDAPTASPLSSDYMYPFQGSQDAQGNQNAFGLGPSATALPVDLGDKQAFDKKVENLEATVRADFMHEEDMDLVKSLLSEDNLGTNSQDAASVGEFGSQGEDGIPDPSSLTASPFVNSGESLASPFSEQGSDTVESPVTEKNKILDGKSATSSLQPHLLKQYALSQEPARKEFLDNLFAYLSKEGKTISKAPVLSGQLLDLFKLYTSVQRHKGFVNVCASHLWKKVIEDLDVANPKALAAHNLRQQYIKFLLPYECALRDENYDDVLAAARRKWHMNSSTVSASADADKDIEEKGSSEPVGQNSDSGATAVSNSDITIPGSDATFSQSPTTNITRNLEQRNLGFPMVPKSSELSKSPRIQEELTSSLPTSLQQQRDPLDSLSSSLNPAALNKQAHFNCSSPKNMQNMQTHYSNSPSTQTLNTGGLSNDWNRRPEMWNQQQYPPDQAFKNMPGQPKGYYGDPYRAALPRHPMYGGGMPHPMASHPVEYAEYQRHGIRPPVPYQHRQPHPMQQMMSDPYRPYRLGRSGMMEYQMHGSGGGMMPPGSPMIPEWAWKQQQQQQQQQHHQHQQQQMRMGSPYGVSYGSHLSPQQQSQQQHHHHRVPSPMMLQQQQQQAFAARLEQQQHHQQQHHHHQQHHQQQHWQDASLRMSKAPYPTSAAQPSAIKSQAVIGMSPQQHMASTSVDPKTSSLTAALEKKVPPEWVNTVEGTKPVFSKKRKLTSNDCGPVEILRLMMSLRSGVLSETTWALDTLNIMLHDDRTVIYFSLKHHNNLCNILTDHLKQCLHDIFGVNFGALSVYNSEHEGADLCTAAEKFAAGMMDILISDYDVLTDKKRKYDDEDERSSSHCPIPVAAVYSKCYTGFTDTTIYVQTHIPSHDDDNLNTAHYYCSQDSNEHENKKVIQCSDETPTSELLRREGICLKGKECRSDKGSVNINEECKVDNCKEVNVNEETAMECDENLNGGNSSSTESKIDKILCHSKVCEELQEENEICSSEEVPLCLTRPQQQSLQERCLCVSNILRSLSFIPGNDTEMSRNHGLLRVLGRLLLLHHRHIVRSTSKKSLSCAGEEALECSALPPSQPWWQDCLDQLQENTFVILANISGQLDLSKCPECIAYPILDGLIHWCVCTSARALDPLPSSAMVFTLSPQRLVLEALAKMSIVENNIDLILATPPFNRLDKLYAHLVQLLSHKHQPVVRQFALVLLSNLAQGDETASHQIGQQECILSLLLESIEDAEHALLTNRSKHPSAVANVEDPNVLSVAMLRRAAITLHCLAKVPQNRPQFVMLQDRLLYLSCSEFLEQSVASIMMDVMYELGKVG